MDYFISDLHCGHKNVLTFDCRPFNTIEGHDATIIKNWNDRVADEDTVYILGDVSWHNAAKTIEIFKKLKGKKHLILGNHDGRLLKNAKLRGLFETVSDYKEVTVGDNHIVLCHYPIICYKNHYYGWYHFYGHVHNSWEYKLLQQVIDGMNEAYTDAYKLYNVGCMMDYMGYTPRTFEEITNYESR